MERTAMRSAAAWPAYDDGNAGAPAISAFGGEICDLIECAGDEVGKLHFSYWPHSHQGGADCRANDARFRDRRVDDSPLTKSLEHARRDFKCAAINADIFA